MPEQDDPLDEVRVALRATVKDLMPFVGTTRRTHRFRSSVTGKVESITRKKALLRVQMALEAFDLLLDGEPGPAAPGYHIYNSREKKFVGWTNNVSTLSGEGLIAAEFYEGALDEQDSLNDPKVFKDILSRQAYVLEELNVLVEKG